tara:strand:+ start:83 stop:547 length:465 start_codon:yes stop_codon:yes gene_type:complete
MFGLTKRDLKLNTHKITPTYIVIVLTLPIIIGLYGAYRAEFINSYEDILEIEIFKGSSNYGLDGWSISHYLCFLVAGYIYPNTLVITIGLGILWELFETYVGKYRPKILENIGFIPNADSRYKGKIWWYGKWSDIIVNFLGFVSGRYLSRKFKF